MILLIGACTLAGGALAQELPGARAVWKQLYRTGKNATAMNLVRPDLVPDALKPALKQAPRVQKYYEAMAVSPDEGMQAQSASLATGYHSVRAARAAAVAACNARKKAESADCVVVAEFVPKGYKPGKARITLSWAATEAFRKYRRGGKPRAFAISPATGAFGQAVRAASPEGARTKALAICRDGVAKAGAQDDCRVISAD